MNRALPISIGINALLLVLLFLAMRGCNSSPCEDALTIRYVDTIYKLVENVKPDVTEVVPVIRSVHRQPSTTNRQHISSLSPLVSVSASAEGAGVVSGTPLENDCSALVQYEDTFYKPDEYRAILHELVNNNKIISRKISWWNLQPEIIKHVDKTIVPKERVRVYLGLSVGFEASYAAKKVSNFNVGPDVFITEPHGCLVGYGYDAKNNGHRVTFAYKIKLRK